MRCDCLWFVMIGFGISLTGCGASGSGSQTYPVKGTVTYQGNPVAGATVAFYNKDPDGKPARGTTDANGNYQLKTFLGGANFQSGAEAGDYFILVTRDPGTNAVAMPDEASMKSLPPEEQQKKAQELMTGGMSKGGEQKMAGGPLASRGGVIETSMASTLPTKYADTKTSDLAATVKAGENNIPIELKD